MKHISFQVKRGWDKTLPKSKAVQILRLVKFERLSYCVYFVAVVLRYGGRFPGGTARACSLSHLLLRLLVAKFILLVPWESPPSLRTTNFSSILSKSLHNFRHEKRTFSVKIYVSHHQILNGRSVHI